tara:strand:+ start:745 stop:897 length:153 start_codon:yes stop_codon:yes gene_type:complete
MEINNTSVIREIEYRKGIKIFLFLRKGDEIRLDKHSTSLQHRFKPCPATG